MSPRHESAEVFPSLAELVALRGAARRIELDAQRLALATSSGAYRSVFRGRGLEFDEVRVYQPGDEVRAIDWRVSARRGRVHTKLYREERERPVLLLVDLHPGMLFGSRWLKSAQALHAAALLAWAAERAGDRVGGVVVARAGHRAHAARLRQEAVLGLLQTLVELQPRAIQPPCDALLNEGLRRLAAGAHPGSLIPVLSDFQGLDAAGERQLQRLALHNDLLLVWIFDPLEAEPPPPGQYRLGVAGRILALDSSALAERWRQRFEQQRARLEQLARRLRCPVLPLASDAPAAQVLARGGMKTATDPLAALRPLHVPAPVEWWPPAPGWWVLVGLGVALLTLVWWLRRRRALRRAALRELRRLQDDARGDGDFAAGVNQLLRRFALVCYPRREVAALSGEAWLAFLETHSPAGGFAAGPGRALLRAPYAPRCEFDRDALAVLARGWIRRQRVSLE